MEIRPLRSSDYLWYPSVVAVEASVVFSDCGNEGEIRRRTTTSAGSQADMLHVESAVYDPRRNALMVSCRNPAGSVLTYRLRLDAGSQETKERRTLTCRVISLPYKENGHKQRGQLETRNGIKLQLTRLKQESAVMTRVESWVKEALKDGLPTTDFTSVAQPWKQRLTDIMLKHTYWEESFRKRNAAHTIANALTGWLEERITIQQALDWHLIPDYPEVTLPYSMFHKYDTAEKLVFQGLFMPLCKDANRLNLQTANRISRATGETVTPEDIVQAIAGKSLPSVVIGGKQVFCLATATQITKEVS